MSRFPEIKTELKWQVAENLDQALKRLEELLLPDSGKINEYVLLKSRYNAYLNSVILGVSSKAELDGAFNQISHALLLFVDGLQDKDLKPGPTQPAQSPGKRGELLYYIPAKMQIGREYRCAVRMAYLKEILYSGWKDNPDDVQLPVRIAGVMSVELINLDESAPFAIRTPNDPVQFLEEDDFTEWLFYVKARRGGEFELMLKVAVLEIRNGREVKKDVVIEQHVVVTTGITADAPEQFEKGDIQLVFDSSAEAKGVATPAVNQANGQELPEKTDKIRRFGALFLAFAIVSITALTLSWPVLTQQQHFAQAKSKEQEQALAELEATYNGAVSQLEQQKGLNAELDGKINEQLSSLEENKKRIERDIQALGNYKPALADLKNQADQYLVEVDRLRADMGIPLEQFAPRLQKSNENLAERQKRLSEESALAELISEKTHLEVENNAGTKKGDIAMAVRVKDVAVKAVTTGGGSLEEIKSKNRKVDKLNICFVTEPNEVTPAGEETFFLTIIDPTGTPLTVESQGSGVAQNTGDEQVFRYTTTATCNYKNGESSVCGVWQPGQSFAKGKYTVQIFNKGYLVGTGSFKLK